MPRRGAARKNCWSLPELIESPPFWFYLVGFVLLLGPLVTVHEFGHYLVGRMFGVGVDAFSVGFGREIAGFTDRRGTRWKLSMLPLGGYCQFKGDMNPASIPDADAVAAIPAEERDGSFHHAALWKRALIVAAGPVTNLVVAVAIFAAFNMAYGRIEAPPVVDHFAESSVAQAAGMAEGDRVIALDGSPVEDFMAIKQEVALYPGKRIVLTVDRDGSRRDIPVTLGSTTVTDRFGNESRIGLLGIYAVEPKVVPMGPGEAVAQAFVQSGQVVDMMVVGVGQIVTGQRSVEELGGPIKIAKYSGEQLSLGPQAFLWFAAMISLNLAFINLLPIPALDGGHLAFYAAEAVRRKPIGARGQELAFRAGVAVILALMLFVTVNDLVSLPVFGR